MAKMNEDTFKVLYDYGKRVYKGELTPDEAARAAYRERPDEVAESSAKHYITWYSRMRDGSYLSWNTNAKLLIYYVKRIIQEEGMEAGKIAISSAQKYADNAGRDDITVELKKIAEENDCTVSEGNEKNFEAWLRRSEKQYLDSTIRKYIRSLKKVSEWFGISLAKPILMINSTDEFESIKNKIVQHPDFKKINQEHGHGDLSAALHLYQDFLSSRGNETKKSDTDMGAIKGEEKNMTIKQKIAEIGKYIESHGFTYPDGLIENFYLSLKSKPFVILAGTSGTGKTKLVKLFSEAIGATSAEGGGNGRYKLVSVRPDWSDSSDLFGHVNLKGEFVPGVVIDFIDKAVHDIENPYFLCFDEMNLARVEYYLSDFLSLMETRRKHNDEIITDEVILDKAAKGKYESIYLPENLYIIGTVNMDETTFPFSKKVLDRANTIEFSYVDLVPSFEDVEKNVEPIVQKNEFLKPEYILLKADIPAMYYSDVTGICEELQDINRILQTAQEHVGYRVRDEIVFYMINNKVSSLLSYEDAMDNEIMQKILPRIQGSSSSIKEMLCELFKKFAGDYTGLNQSDISDQMQAYIDSKSCKYRKSAEKICYMMRRFEEDGFTSYWL